MKDQKEAVQKVIDYIEKNLENEINLDKISKNVGYSKFYLNRIFKEYTGLTLYKYVQNRRLTVAAERLVTTDQPIMQIAYEAGYDTQQSFSYAFKQIYLYPPKIYRDIGIFTPKQNTISMCCSCTASYKFITQHKIKYPAAGTALGSLPAGIKEVAA